MQMSFMVLQSSAFNDMFQFSPILNRIFSWILENVSDWNLADLNDFVTIYGTILLVGVSFLKAESVL
jgi:hypothetical protein